jgi:hypothetical protein
MTESMAPTPAPASPQSDGDQYFLSLLCRHLVGICWVTREVGFDGEERGEQRSVCATAVAVESNGRWYLVTSGHIVQLIERIAADASQRITKATLFNAWARHGEATHDPLPIDLYRLKSYARYDRGEGVDFGMILLGDAHVAALTATGTVPISKHHVGVPSGRDVLQYWLLGLPEELQSQVSPPEGGCCLEIEPNVFRVFLRENPGCFFETDQPRLFGDVPPTVPLVDMNGMSGGPLFAFTRGETGFDGWIAGLQSGWNPDARVVAASPAGVYLEELSRGKAHIADLLAAAGCPPRDPPGAE